MVCELTYVHILLHTGNYTVTLYGYSFLTASKTKEKKKETTDLENSITVCSKCQTLPTQGTYLFYINDSYWH